MGRQTIQHVLAGIAKRGCRAAVAGPIRMRQAAVSGTAVASDRPPLQRFWNLDEHLAARARLYF